MIQKQQVYPLITGDKMVDVGAVEVFNSDLNQRRTYQLYLNPEHSIPRDVINAHGITEEKVKKEPTLPELTEKFLNFIKGRTLVVHNAPFDLGFIMNDVVKLMYNNTFLVCHVMLNMDDDLIDSQRTMGLFGGVLKMTSFCARQT